MTALVLLPGLLNDERLWAHQRHALAEQAEVSVADLTADDTMAGLAERVLAAAPDRFALAGLSMGGYVAMEIMRRAPERVERLALVSTAARPDTAEQTERRRDAIANARAGGFDKVPPALLPIMVHPDRAAQERVGGLFVDMARAVGPEAFIRQQTAIMHRPDSRPGLPRISCPTVVVVGRDDTLTPPDRAEEMAALIPGARLVRIGQCGHLSAIEQPQAVSAVLSYWLQG
ncbi:alpha/beta fold hydrolase [Magnetospirillum sp. UT-4]|uniref:alpha/beta fold hydrolase n=1 Tax=Magnetospirillum sp. UT-4 TaxID=2681467 RepID=UPI0013820836|nr:alpha/beta fold hydrolase [Magnetospirillum sp. UT-4]CAA7614187.1 Hydrolase or acyltransferase [Magnetospirillum sp. UT-4]